MIIFLVIASENVKASPCGSGHTKSYKDPCSVAVKRQGKDQREGKGWEEVKHEEEKGVGAKARQWHRAG